MEAVSHSEAGAGSGAHVCLGAAGTEPARGSDHRSTNARADHQCRGRTVYDSTHVHAHSSTCVVTEDTCAQGVDVSVTLDFTFPHSSNLFC